MFFPAVAKAWLVAQQFARYKVAKKGCAPMLR
jgi:hypothetical protein